MLLMSSSTSVNFVSRPNMEAMNTLPLLMVPGDFM
jgi:hypothetical protein